MALADNALVTVDEYSLGTDIPNPSQDPNKLAAAELLINAASSYAENYCVRESFFSGSLANESFIGLGNRQSFGFAHTSHTLQQDPVVGTPVLYWDNKGTLEAIDTSLYGYDTVNRHIYFHNCNGNFFIEDRRYVVKYPYGYDGVVNIPGNLKQAAILLIKFFKIQGDVALGLGSAADATGKNKSYKADDIPIIIKTLLNEYVL